MCEDIRRSHQMASDSFARSNPSSLKTALRWALLVCILPLAITQDIPNSRENDALGICPDFVWGPSQASGIIPGAEPSNADRLIPGEIEGTPIRVLQYNVQFVFPEFALGLVSLSELGHWPSTSERARAIGEAIARECFDIIALNEIVNDKRREDIITAIEEGSSACGNESGLATHERLYTVRGPKLGGLFVFGIVDDLIELLRHGEDAKIDSALLDDEVAIISRFPIIETNSIVFSDSAGIDTAAAKGVLHARIWRGGDSPAHDVIDVYTTHLQAGDFPEIRRSQLIEMAEFIHAISPPSIPILILGDLNIDGLQDPQNGYSAAYLDLVDILSTHHAVEDVGQELGVGTNQTGTRRIDYILLSSNILEVQDVEVERFACEGLNLSFCGEAHPTLSDHAAVAADFVWRYLAPMDDHVCGSREREE